MKPDTLCLIITLGIILGIVIIIFLVKMFEECLIPTWRENAKERRRRKEAESHMEDSAEKWSETPESKYSRLCGLIRGINNKTWPYGIRITVANYRGVGSRDGLPDSVYLDCNLPFTIHAEASEPVDGRPFEDGSEIRRVTLHKFTRKEQLDGRHLQYCYPGFRTMHNTACVAGNLDDAIGWLERFRDDKGPLGYGRMVTDLWAFIDEHPEKGRTGFLDWWFGRWFEESFNAEFGRNETETETETNKTA